MVSPTWSGYPRCTCEHAHGASSRVGGGVGLAPGALWGPMVPVREKHEWVTPRHSWVDLQLMSQRRQQEMHSFNALLYSYLDPSLSFPSSQSLGSLLRNLGPAIEKSDLSSHNLNNWGSQAVTHHFCFLPPLWGISPLPKANPLAVSPWGGGPP